MVHIITDSASDLLPHELCAMGVDCVPSIIIFGDEEYRENVTLSREKFFELLQERKHFPRTAQPSTIECEELFTKYMEMGDETVMITLSSAFSGFYENVTAVKNYLGYENCYIVDGRSVSGGQRILIERAVSLRDEGKSASEIAKDIEELRERIELYACLDTLEYVYRGGRISRTAYAIGTISNIKPVVYVKHDGSVTIIAKMIGLTRGINYIRDRLKIKEPDPDYPIYVLYTCDNENAQKLKEKIVKSGIEIPDEHMITVGAAIGSHVGITGCGLAYVAKK